MTSYDVGKADPKVDYLERSTTEEASDDRLNRFSLAEQRKIIRRIDRRLVLTLGFMYCVSLMDRTNLGIAVVAGMGVDLILIGSRYSIIVLVFFITYVILQVIVPRAFRKPILTTMTAPGDRCLAKDWPTPISSNHHSPLGRHDGLLRVRQSLEFPHSPSSCSGNLRSRLLSRLCLSPELLVPTIRPPETECRLLLDWQHGLCFLGYSCVRVLQDGWTWGRPYLSRTTLWPYNEGS
jgi:hypothetical protein